MPCQNIERCPISLDEGVGPVFKRRFCENNWDACARLQVFREAGPSKVPSWLMPNMSEEADDILLKVRQGQ